MLGDDALAGEEDADDEYVMSEYGDETGAESAEESAEEDSDEEFEESEGRSKRQKTAARDSERLVAELQKKVEKLEGENQHLRSENEGIKNRMLSEIQKIQSSHAVLINEFTAFAGLQATPDYSKHGVRLKQVFTLDKTTNEYDSLAGFEAPTRFSLTGAFPHAVALNKKTKNRELQVECRRVVVMTWVLVSKVDGSRVTEKALPSGELRFKLSLCYSDNMDEVLSQDIKKSGANDPTEPKFDSMIHQNMVNGMISVEFRFNFTNSDIVQRNRSFVVKVVPNPDSCEGAEDLTCTTPPFIIRSKVTAPKAK